MYTLTWSGIQPKATYHKGTRAQRLATRKFLTTLIVSSFFLQDERRKCDILSRDGFTSAHNSCHAILPGNDAMQFHHGIGFNVPFLPWLSRHVTPKQEMPLSAFTGL